MKTEIECFDHKKCIPYRLSVCNSCGINPYRMGHRVKFYMVLSGSSLDKKLGFYPFIMMPTGYFFSKIKHLFSLTKYIPPHNSLFLDSGGFTLLSKWHKYPFTIEQYMNLLKKLKPNLAATMDYPCEPTLEITKSESKLQIPVKERINKTIENNDIMLNNYYLNGTKIIPVIQGWKLNDYYFCIDEMHKKDLLTDYVAFGSMCQRTKGKKLCYKVINHLRKYSDTKIHFFGFKISMLKDYGIYSKIYSCDTAAWTHNPYDKTRRGGKNIYAKTQKELERNWYIYLNKIEKLHNKFIGQQKLIER